MSSGRRLEIFDRWAEVYDSTTEGGPLLGYQQVLERIVDCADAAASMTVLDVGTGTGNLAARFVDLGCDVCGFDFSSEMLVKAKEKLPGVEFIQHDLLNEWPDVLDRQFQRIVSSYVMHELDLPTKVLILRRLARRLVQGGRIVVGDVSFEAIDDRQAAQEKWDEEEFYWAASEIIPLCNEVGLRVDYHQVSVCGGVYVFEPV